MAFGDEYISKKEAILAVTQDGCTANVVGILYHLPPADVVPKSEVDRLETEVRLLTENSISAKYPCCVSTSKGLILTKSLEEYDKLLADIASEVAREIFEESESVLSYSVYPQIRADRTIRTIKSKDFTVRAEDYNTIKKKYTEGE